MLVSHSQSLCLCSSHSLSLSLSHSVHYFIQHYRHIVISTEITEWARANDVQTEILIWKANKQNIRARHTSSSFAWQIYQHEHEKITQMSSNKWNKYRTHVHCGGTNDNRSPIRFDLKPKHLKQDTNHTKTSQSNFNFWLYWWPKSDIWAVNIRYGSYFSTQNIVLEKRTTQLFFVVFFFLIQK